MPENFDPYRKWFGIPPEDQPPNHYRLLGTVLFEADEEVIDNAANQRMAFVKNFQAGKHSIESQRMLNEIAAARVCLLDRDRKRRYDQELRENLFDSETPVLAVAVESELSEEPTDLNDLWQTASKRFKIPPPSEKSGTRPGAGVSPLVIDNSMIVDVDTPIAPPLPAAPQNNREANAPADYDGPGGDIVEDLLHGIKKATDFICNDVFVVVKSAAIKGDKLLKDIAGEDNDLVHYFLRGAVVFFAAFFLVAILAMAFSGG